MKTAGALALAMSAMLIGCSPTESKEQGSGEGKTTTAGLKGEIVIDGSSTVQPISEAIAEEFNKSNPDVQLTVAKSGTGGGFKKFAAGELDITGASRPIEESEIKAAKENGIEFVEIAIAFDGLSVVVNPKNTFVDTLTVAELKKIFEPESKVKTWADVRAGFPKEPIKLYGAGTDSGTFDYFTKAIVGEEKASRKDYQASEDDNVLVQGVSGDEFSLGYFGYAYVVSNQDKLKLVKIDAGKGGVEPNAETIANGTYQPLSRPLLLYVNKKSLEEKPEVKAFLEFLFESAKDLIGTTGYVALPDEAYSAAKKRVDGMILGSAFKGAEVGVSITDVLSRTSAN
jgi:phosphate transport system substrate-binding protein